MKRVLVIRFSSLGDVLLALPSVRWLKENGHEVHFLTKEAFRPVLELMDIGVRIHTIPNHANLKELKARAAALRELAFDEVYDLHRNLRSFLVTRMLGVPFRRISKYRFKETVLFIFRRGIFSVFFKALNRRGEGLRLVGDQGAEGKARPGECLLRVKESTRLPAGDKSRRVCIALESAWVEKEWPIERFAEVARQLIASGNQVVWLGLRPLPSIAQISEAIDLTARLSIEEVAGVLAGSRLLVANDSGLMHLAEAVGTPAVAVFGPTSTELGFSPSLPQSQVVEADLWCRPCSKTGRWCFRPIDRRLCLKAVAIEDVMAAVNGVLGSGEPGANP